MPKELIFMTVCPDDLYFWWQLRVQCYNFRRMGYSDKYHVLVFVPHNRVGKGPNPKFKELEKEYPEVTLHYYYDTKGNCLNATQAFNYIPLLRPWCLQHHFEKYPELKDKAIFYTDQDVLFTRKIDFEPFLNDDISYLSWAGRSETRYNYLNGDYFDLKATQVAEDRKELFEKADPIGELAKKIGITKEIIYKNNDNTGGAQYLLKGVDAKFWLDVFDSSAIIKMQMHKMNQFFFPGDKPIDKENNGYQAWCADMWAVLWNLWKRDLETACPKEMDFLWATDPIERILECNIYHHAGGHEAQKDGQTHYTFDKRKMEYVNNVFTPYQDLETVNRVSKDFCASFYAREIINSQ